MRKSIAKYGMMMLLSCLFTLTVSAQTNTANIVRGKVTAKEDGEPLISVTVTEIDASNRIYAVTVTNYDGEYVLQVNNRANKLKFRYMGFEDLEIPIGEQKVINASMAEKSTLIDDVVITAKAMTNTGVFNIPQREVSMSMQKIDAEEFEGISVASIDDALQGQIAGLDIVNVSGEPGAGMSMRIRGTTSLNATNEPLIVVNDVIFNTQIDADFDFATANEEQYAQLISVAPDDIATITVLKDAAATAMWGTRGANGVLLITTKRGKKGPTRVSYSYSYTRKRQPKGMNMLNGDDYTMLMKQSYYNPDLNPSASDIPEFNYDTNFTEYENYNNNTDWREEVSRIARVHDNQLTVSGGGESVTFRVSAGYYTETGTVIGQLLNRLSMRSSIDYDVSKRIKFSADFAYTYADNDKNYENPLGVGYQKMPNLSVYAQDLDGNDTDVFYHIRTDSKLADAQKNLSNPVAVAMLARNNQRNYRTSPAFHLQYEILDPQVTASSLRLKLSASFDINASQTRTFFPKDAANAIWSDERKVNRAEGSDSESTSISGDADLSFVPALSNIDHSVRLSAKFNISSGTTNSMGTAVAGLPSLLIQSPSSDANAVSLSNSSKENPRSLRWSWNFHYAYKGRYIASGTVAVQSSSKFGKNFKTGLFPAISGKWIISDEPFFGSLRDFISEAGFRWSFGYNGNEPGGSFLWLSRYGEYPEKYIDMTAVRPLNMVLANLRWEKTTQLNGGLDLQLLDGKYDLGFDAYYKHTTDALFNNVGISTYSGYADISSLNDGTIDNQGWELHGRVRDLLQIGNVRMDLSFNFSNNKNTIVELSDEILARYNKDYTYDNASYLTRIQEGNPVGSIYGFVYEGVYEYNEYDPAHPEHTCPIVRNEKGEPVFDAEGNTKPMYFAYGNSAAYQFKAGDAIYRDINHDGSIDELDIVYLGNSLPVVTGGFGLNFRWKRLSFNAFFNYRYGNKVVNMARLNAESMRGNDNQSIAVNWRWRKEGDQTEMPRALYNYGYNSLGSDRYVEDASFLRFKYMTFNYTVPREMLTPLKLNSMSLYLSIQNVAVFTKYTGVDPEVGAASTSVATDSSKTPRSKDILFRLRLGF
ncbi:MAG: SusC/RagA family TonB-linked outer membrane protein [Bacteroidales bacterium]|nr:SusC/RagA family TonB-linked outer membrane protein [Bacteroidales bacterium]